MSGATFLTLHKGFSDALAKAFASSDIEIIKAQYAHSKGSDSDKKAALDQSFRDLMFSSVVTITTTEAPVNDRIEQFISFSILACRQDLITTAMPVVLMGDVFDAVTLDQCEKLFTYVEDNVAVWREDWIFTACKNNLLRMCNDLLRRLSRSQNTVFCGRILLFLAKFFPFSERSGLNIVSEFNLENLTEYESDGTDIGDALIDSENVQVKIDYNLYCKFWALQDFFRNPNQCYNKVQWKTFASHAASVLSAFNSFKLEEHRSSSSGQKTAAEEAMDIDEDEIKESQHFFAKFLTNPKLLALQLSDSNFRRSVLVQCLILFQYLRSTVKFKSETFSLSTNQTDFIKETEVQIYKLIDETPPNGKRFSKTVRHMLQREELWNNWKNEGCKEFSRPEIAQEDASIKMPPLKRQKRSLGESVRDSNKLNKFYMGNVELTRLWNLCPDNLQACRGSDRNFLPSIETYLENPKDKTDPTFEWRALRLLARQSPHFFSLSQPPNKVSDYLEGVRKKIHESNARIKVEPPEIKTEIVVVEKDDGLVDEVQDDGELIKAETIDDKNTHKTAVATPEQMKDLCVIIGASYKKLGVKLGYNADVLKFFVDSHPLVTDQCKAMLHLWFDEDDDASLDNLGYILEGLDMIAAADAVKRILEPVDKMEDISE